MHTDTGPVGGRLAGLGKRAAAFIIDTVLFAVVLAVVLVVPLLVLLSNPETGALLAGFVLLQLVVTVGFFGYRIVLEGMYGYTVGKKLLGIGVVTEDGSDISWKAAAIRNLVLIADNLPIAYLLGVGLILYDDGEQRLGDMAADTYVVRV